MLHIKGCKLEHVQKMFSQGVVCHYDIHLHLNQRKAFFDRDEQTHMLGRIFENGYGQIHNKQLLTAFIETYSWDYGTTLLNKDFFKQNGENMWGEKYLWEMLTQRSLFGVRPPNGVFTGWLDQKELNRISNYMQKRSFEGFDRETKHMEQIFQTACLEKKDLICYGVSSHIHPTDKNNIQTSV